MYFPRELICKRFETLSFGEEQLFLMCKGKMLTSLGRLLVHGQGPELTLVCRKDIAAAQKSHTHDPLILHSLILICNSRTLSSQADSLPIGMLLKVCLRWSRIELSSTYLITASLFEAFKSNAFSERNIV
jgi:hypothetical protein